MVSNLAHRPIISQSSGGGLVEGGRGLLLQGQEKGCAGKLRRPTAGGLGRRRHPTPEGTKPDLSRTQSPAQGIKRREHLPHWNRFGASLDAAYQAALGAASPPPTTAQRRKPDLLRQQTFPKPQVRILLGVLFCGRNCAHPPPCLEQSLATGMTRGDGS
jgi:hypothetical protein